MRGIFELCAENAKIGEIFPANSLDATVQALTFLREPPAHGYSSEAACKSAAQDAETEWLKEGDDVTKLGRDHP
jgi:hypothetical protein